MTLENKVTIQRHEELTGILLLGDDLGLGGCMERLLLWKMLDVSGWR